MIGKRLGRYLVLAEAGAGGMGTVYRAHDERLDRDVALKILNPAALGGEQGRARFRNEAVALARLNHPNIGAVYDFDSHEGVDFLVMEYVDGQTLAARVVQGCLTEKEAGTLGMQIASALEEAHRNGVIHRDLKPGNVMLTPKGGAKVLDFGLAKLLGPPGSLSATLDLTATSAAIGTPPYMAPEQLTGAPVDARTDIYALGLILYEMVTGRRAFREELATMLVDAILHRAPVSPRAIQDTISPEFERIVMKCLEKDPDDRYQSARELEVDLRRLVAPRSGSLTAPIPIPRRSRNKLWYAVAGAAGATALAALLFFLWPRLSPRIAPDTAINSIAVLPLENLSHDPGQQYFADGMTDELITTLSQIGGLRVIARTSVMHYKDTSEPVARIAKELGVAAVVEGTVLSADGEVRITAQLIQPSTNENLWAQSYDGRLKDVIALQNQVARDIARQIRAKLQPDVQARLASNKTVNPQAFQAYLKGRYYRAILNPQAARTSLRYYQESVKEDPNYAEAYASLAEEYVTTANNGWMDQEEGLREGEVAAQEALARDPNQARAYLALSMIAGSKWDWAAAERDWQRVLALNPGYARAWEWHSYMLAETGRIDQAVKEAEHAADLDPLSPLVTFNTGQILYWARSYQQASAELQKIIAANPNFFVADYYAGCIDLQEGKLADGIRKLERANSLAPGEPTTLATLVFAYAHAGERPKAESAFEELRRGPGGVPASPYLLALAELGLSEKDKAIASLELAYQQRDIKLPLMLPEPLFDSLRSDPRFQAILAKMGLPVRTSTEN
jgi:serine/threonine protein kinase/tetratricopeptide (TPR) repeat protein